MHEIRTEIQIAASPEKVWSTLTDFKNWKSWNPTANQASGEASVGSTLTITMRNKDGSNGHAYKPVITALEKPKFMRWKSKMLFAALFANDKTIELKESNGGTLLVHNEVFSGFLIPLVWNKMSSGIAPMLKSMNEALKEKVEQS